MTTRRDRQTPAGTAADEAPDRPLEDLSRDELIHLVRQQQEQLAARQTPEDNRLRLSRFAVDRFPEATFIVNAENQILDVNEMACERLGYSREELLQMDVGSWDSRYRPEIWPDHFEDLKRKGKAVIESEHRSKDGRVFPVQINEFFFRFEGNEYCCSFVFDITDRKRAERDLRLRRSAVDTAAEAIFAIDTAGNIVDANTTGCHRLEYTRDELIGMSTATFDVLFDVDNWPNFYQLIKSRGSLVVESQHRTKSGRLFPVEISVAYFEFEGEEYFCSFVRDITEHKRLEREQGMFQEELERTNNASRPRTRLSKPRTPRWSVSPTPCPTISNHLW